VAQLAVILASGGEVVWLARAYAIAIAVAAVLKVISLVRYRTIRPGPRPYRAPLNLRLGRREWPVGLISVALLIGIPGLGLLLVLDPPSVAGIALVGTVAVALSVSARAASATPAAAADALDPFQLLPSDDADLTQVAARPGNFLVPVRKPHSLAHLTAALRAAGERDVVALAVRLVGLDVPDDPGTRPHVTDDERRLLSGVIASAEREGRAVRLMIVPGVNVFDSVVDTALKLQSAEIHVGESETLSADDQARLLGDAWERAEKPSGVDV